MENHTAAQAYPAGQTGMGNRQKNTIGMNINPPSSDKPAPDRLLAPVQFLKGVGPERAALLERIGVRTISDLLFLFPRDYQDLTDFRPMNQLEEDKWISVCGRVEEVDFRIWPESGRSMVGVLVMGQGGYVRAVWFNQLFMREKFRRGQRVVLTGRPKLRGMVWQMHHPKVLWLEADEEPPPGRILPVYPLTEGLQQYQVRRLVERALDEYAEYLEEAFPQDFLQSHRLWPIHQAIRQIHFPEDQASLQQARRRFIYQELFVLQLALALRRQAQTQRQAPVLKCTALIDARIRRLFPFELTDGQNRAIREIADDMAKPIPMNRLLQGDVGSGKTVVAVYAMLLAVAHGYQAVLMAPTEILARQHAQTLDQLLAHSRVRRALLVGGLPEAERADLVRRIAEGQIDLVVGTQAVIQKDVQFAKLGLVVIDEQHRFGVRQRAWLKRAGLDPHYLVMTATPIPRTLTLAFFGDLDVSVLPDSPPGRQKVHTYLADPSRRPAWWAFFRKKLAEGRQGYVVAPLVEESEEQQAANAVALYEELSQGELKGYRLGLLHGRLPPDEKDRIMDQFRRQELHVLVCTTVIEVGVDVPNATLMTIEGGERFGLAQLHQLRGRISRGNVPGFCCVFANPTTEESRRRLEAFQNTTDGFALAELDFQLRGPGELFGIRQHGMPPFRIADLVRDADILQEARRDAQALVASDPGLAKPEHARLRQLTLRRYGHALELADVG